MSRPTYLTTRMQLTHGGVPKDLRLLSVIVHARANGHRVAAGGRS
jgi:hypothetical protein